MFEPRHQPHPNPARWAVDGLASGRWRSVFIYAAAGWSGFFVMGVELLGGRLLAPYFGSSIFVWGAIIAVFMLCLALGYLVGGHLSLHEPSAFKLGALLMGASVAALPIMLLAPMLDWLSVVVPDPRYGSLLASLMLFGLSTVISGMVSPYAVRLLIDDLGQSGRSAGLLYFVSTVGSALGTLLTSFYLVLYLEINTIVWLLAGVSLCCGAGLMALKHQKMP